MRVTHSDAAVSQSCNCKSQLEFLDVVHYNFEAKKGNQNVSKQRRQLLNCWPLGPGADHHSGLSSI